MVYRFDGRMDEPRIYNRALSSGDILNLYRSNLAKYNVDKRRFDYQGANLAKASGYQYIFTGTTLDSSGNTYLANSNFFVQSQNGQYIYFT